jgi:hypothetical protein
VQAELKRLQLAKKSMPACKRRVAFKESFESMESAFQNPDCFSTASFMIQAKEKFLTYASMNSDVIDDDGKNAMEKDFLLGCCADFARRLSLYALNKNNADDAAFSFRPSNLELEKGGTDNFYEPIDSALVRYPPTFLSCPTKMFGKQNEPLPMLRSVLPGTVGVAVARLWVLCGGDSYQGGTKVASDGCSQSFTRPGEVEGFVSHVKENCISICGLPFTNLDKKSEKKFLNARKQRLTELLDQAKDVETVLELRIMLLYQLVKNMVVSGPLLRGPVLQLLVTERKLSESAAAELLDAATKIDSGHVFGITEIERIRNCGMSKSKN